MTEFSIVSRRPTKWGGRRSELDPVLEAIRQTVGTDQSVFVPANGKPVNQVRELIRINARRALDRNQRLCTSAQDDGVYFWVETR